MFELIVVSIGGGGSKIPDPKPLPVAPREVLPEAAKAKSDLKKRLQLAQGRAASRQPGVLQTAGGAGLTDKLGGFGGGIS